MRNSCVNCDGKGWFIDEDTNNKTECSMCEGSGKSDDVFEETEESCVTCRWRNNEWEDEPCVMCEGGTNWESIDGDY